uniref:BAR domain-containing protein n=1 Tax=Heterorhabditis bacteriophora TaxID=37862 RepID=A0A1I7XSF3_HETBA
MLFKCDALQKLGHLKDQDPMEKLKKAVEDFQYFIPSGEKSMILNKLINSFDNAANLKREHQIRQRHSIRHLRRFTVTEYRTLVETRDKFNQAKSNMDMAKHEVKQSKSTEQIEKRAILYQQTVEIFDEHCNMVMKQLEELTSIKGNHANDMDEFITAHKDYHITMANILK